MNEQLRKDLEYMQAGVRADGSIVIDVTGDEVTLAVPTATKAAARAGSEAAGLLALGRTSDALELVQATGPQAIQSATKAARIELLTRMSLDRTYGERVNKVAARELKAINRTARTPSTGAL